MRYSAVLVFALVLVIANPFGLLWSRDAHYPPGVLIPDEPTQTALKSERKWRYKDYLITALAEYEIEARIVRLRNYYWPDHGRDLSPIDFTVAWGLTSDQQVLDQLSISLSNRFYHWRLRGKQLPASEDDIEDHLANMHLIPADDGVRERLGRFNEGDLIALRGFLVKADRPDGFHWQSSLTRMDSGDGACELMWVEVAERTRRAP